MHTTCKTTNLLYLCLQCLVLAFRYRFKIDIYCECKVGSSSYEDSFYLIYKERYIAILLQKYTSSDQFPKSLFHILVPQTINDGVQHRAYKSIENSNNFRLLH